MKLRIEDAGPPAEVGQLKRFAERFQRPLPADVVSFWEDHDGCCLESNLFLVGANGDSGVRRFLAIDEIDQTCREVPDLAGRRCVPIAAAEGGNYVCLRVRDGSSWRVDFWDHETGVFECVAQSFSAFISMLNPIEGDLLSAHGARVLSVEMAPGFLESLEEDD